MFNRKVAAICAATMMMNSVVPGTMVSATTVTGKAIVQEQSVSERTQVSRFDTYYTQDREAYDAAFRMNNDNIIKIESSGGSLRDNVLPANMLDGNINTYWETKRHTSDSFKNELTFTLKDAAVLNRIAYRSATNKVGFAESFEIWTSAASEGDDFELAAQAEVSKTADMLEIKFDPALCQRVKFVFKNHGTATVSEIMFYEEDTVTDEVKHLFADDSYLVLTEAYRNQDTLDALAKRVEGHPLERQYNVLIHDAKMILSKWSLSPSAAQTREVNYFENGEYNKEYQVPRNQIQSIVSAGGHYWNQMIDFAIDGNHDTYWETRTANTESFKNEVEVTFKDSVVLDRIAYAARKTDRKGFATKFEIYASNTSRGDNYQLLTTGTHNSISGVVEAKFEATEVKRIKFKFIDSTQNWASFRELLFYTPDEVYNAVDTLFTDASMSSVNAIYASPEKLNALEEKAKVHPLYEQFRQTIEDAKAVLNQTDTAAVMASTSRAEYTTNMTYNNEYKISNDQIESITNNGRHYANQNINLAVDGDESTYWETNSWNRNGFSNEVVVTFKSPVTLNRLTYGARQSDLKGFAEEFQIYGSMAAKGDNFQLVATGKHNPVSGQVEAKFPETQFKRLKFVFVQGKQEWATLNELAFYQRDAVLEGVDALFTDGTMSAVSKEYNTEEKINAFQETAKAHPLYKEFKDTIEYAKDLIGNSKEADVRELEMRGDSVKESQKRKVWSFKDWQVTGYYALGGQTINVYVDVEDGQPVPTLLYRQAMTQHGGTTEFVLKKGKNVITIPTYDKVKNQIPDDVIQGGELFFTNYGYNETIATPDGFTGYVQAPKVRVEGAGTYPVYKLGESDDQKVLEQLEAYVAQMNASPETMPNIFAVSGEKSLCLVEATYALEYYNKTKRIPRNTAQEWDHILQAAQYFWGFDNSSELHSDWNYRMVIMVKNLGNGAFMNAGGGVIGIRTGSQNGVLGADMGWGFMHELGHNFDTTGRVLAEVTNNIMPLFFESWNKGYTRITEQNIYENNTYPKVGLSDYSNNALYDVSNYSHLAQLVPLWQLYMYDNTFYPKFEQQYREKNFGINGNRDELYRSWVVAASDAMQLDLTEFFERHGIRLSESKKAEIQAKYQKPDQKIYYLNDRAINYAGNGFTSNAKAKVSAMNSNGKVKLVFEMDENNQEHLLGYEIFKDGEYIGFTATGSFVDQNSNINDYAEYTVTPYDIKLNAMDSLTATSKDLCIMANPVVTLQVGEQFQSGQYVIAKDMAGNVITDRVAVKESTVNTEKAGIYKIVYCVTDENNKEYTTEVKVVVAERSDYLSDLTPIQKVNGWGTVRKDLSITGRALGLRRGDDIIEYAKGLGLHAYSEYIYNVSGEDYDFFESYVGTDKEWFNGTRGSVEFKVVVDGVERYNSGLMKASTDQQYVKVNIKGASEVKLIITTGGNGNEQDHGNWADAKFVTE